MVVAAGFPCVPSQGGGSVSAQSGALLDWAIVMNQDASRRSYPRFACSGSAEIYRDAQRCGWATVSEIGAGGCYIETSQPLPFGTDVQLRLTISDAVLEVGAKVVWATPQIGMGMHFEAVSPKAEDQLALILAKLAGQPDISGGEFAMGTQSIEFCDEASAGLRIGKEVIAEDVAPAILARIIERINRAGVLTQQELVEIVKAGQ
jgi:Tfp pilus assembly protein PilZ